MTDRTAYDMAAALIAAGDWAVDPNAGTIRNRAGRVLGGPNAKGYQRVWVRIPGAKPRMAYVHRVVFEAAHGAIANGLTIDHRDGNKSNNAASNLDVVPIAENLRRARVMGLIADKGVRNTRAAFTPQLVRHLRRHANSGLSHADLSRWYGVTQSTISRILRGDRYAEVK